MKNSFLFIALIISSYSIFCQTRIAVYGIEFHKSRSKLIEISPDGRSQMAVVPSKIISYFSNDPNFKVIDRKNIALIEEELERQKSESFIDGYIVDQGKAEGANYICRSFYDADNHSLNISIYDVEKGEILCSQEKKMDASWWRGIKELDEQLTVMLHTISTKCFDRSFPVVRFTKEKKGKAKELLVLVGYAQKIKLDYEMEIVAVVEERIGDITKMRNMKIGEGFIILIEDENFSILKVMSGGEAIYNAINAGQKVKCRLID